MKRRAFILLAFFAGIVLLLFLYSFADRLERLEQSEFRQTESQAPRFEIHDTNIAFMDVITDNQTGAQYLWYKGGMTPLLNSDGSLCLDGEVGGPLP